MCIYMSYLQNILLISLIIVRLPWIIGLIGLPYAMLSASLAFLIVCFDRFNYIIFV